MPDEGPKYLTTAEVAEELRLDTDTVRNLLNSKRLPAVKFGDRGGYRVHRDTLDAFVKGELAPKATPTRRRAAK